MNRRVCVTKRVSTPFGTMYVHVDLDGEGKPIGGAISDPRKEPDSTVAALIESLSKGLHAALKREGQDDR